MSPQIKKTAIGSSVAALTLILVLSAIAVAHRDARNMPANPIETNPDYARQEVRPLVIPPGMVSRVTESRQFPHSDVNASSDLQSIALPTTRTIEHTEPCELSSKVQFVAQSKPSNLANAHSNPLRETEDVSTEQSDVALDNTSDESGDATSMVQLKSRLGDSNEIPADNNLERDIASQDVLNSSYSEQTDAPQSAVSLARYDVPPGQQNSNLNAGPNSGSSSQLMPPPLPSFGPATQLPSPTPAMQNGQPSLAAPPAFPSLGAPQSTATLLPPTANRPTSQAPLSTPPSFTANSNLAAPAPIPNPMATPTPGMMPAALPSTTQATMPATNNSSGPAAGNPMSMPPLGFGAPTENNLQSYNTAAPSTNYSSAGSQPFPMPAGTPERTIPAREISREVSQPAMVEIPSSLPRRASALAGSIVADEFVSSRPGDRSFDGIQSPTLELIKEAPEEVQVGHPATFTLLLKNMSRSPVHNVVVQDVVPKGAKLQATNPPADVLADGRLAWKIGTIPAGGQQVLTVELIPETEGELGSVATVSFSAQSSVRTVATQPKLIVQQEAQPKVLIGENSRVHITVANEGSGMAYDVSLRAGIPAGFKHPQGDYLGLSLGDIAPGQSQTVDLDLEAADSGKQQNIIRVIAANAEEIISETPIEVIAPKLQVRADGPKLRYLERQATYNVTISNLGTARARDIELIAYLPRGLRFNSAGNRGEYLPDQHAVIWMLEELEANTEASTDLVLMPVQEGDYVLRFLSRADRSNAEPFEKQVRVEGQSELAFSIEDDNDPIEIDGQTTYVVRVSNLGTRQDANIEIAVDLPDGATLLEMSAPVEYQQQQDKVLFAPIPLLNPKDERVIRFTVELNQEGIQVMRASVKSQLRPLVVVKEESTQVYSDQ